MEASKFVGKNTGKCAAVDVYFPVLKFFAKTAAVLSLKHPGEKEMELPSKGIEEIHDNS
jgi:hypothetical protein